MENKQTSKSVFKNVLYGFSTWVVPLALSFIATPIIVRSLGHKDYGIYALILGFVGYSFTFSIGRAATKYIAEYKATGENEKIRGIISATFLINALVGILGVAVIFLLADWLVRDVFLIEPAERQKSVYSFYIASGTIFFLTVNQVFNAVLQGIHRFDVYSKIYNFFSIAQLVGNILLAIEGFGLIYLLGWNLVMTSAMCCGYLISAKKLLPEFGINFNLRLETVRLVLHFSSGIIGYQVLGNILLLFERSWITRRLGAESLTFYVVPFTLALYILSFIISLNMVFLPLASELKNEPEKLLGLYKKATKMVLFFVVFIGLTLIIGSDYFLSLWMGEAFAEKSSDLLILHTLTFGVTAIGSVAWQLTEALGYPKYNALVFSICLVICVGLMILLSDVYGNFGIALGRLTGYAVITFSIFYVEKWFFGKVQIGFWAKMLGILIVPTILAGLSEKLIMTNFPANWWTFISSVLVGGIIYCAGLYLLGFVTAEEKTILRNLYSR